MAQALDSLNEAHLLPSLHKSYPNPGNSLHAGPALRQALTQGRPPNAEEWEQSRAESRVNWWRLATIASPVLPSWLPVNRYRLLPSWRGRVIPYRLQH